MEFAFLEPAVLPGHSEPAIIPIFLIYDGPSENQIASFPTFGDEVKARWPTVEGRHGNLEQDMAPRKMLEPVEATLYAIAQRAGFGIVANGRNPRVLLLRCARGDQLAVAVPTGVLVRTAGVPLGIGRSAEFPRLWTKASMVKGPAFMKSLLLPEMMGSGLF